MVQSNIAENPEKITITRQGTTSDGFGGTVIDPEDSGSNVTLTVRISHERAQVPKYDPATSGLSTNLQRFILSDYQNEIQENDTFDYIDKAWRIGPVDTLIKFEGIYGYQAVLEEAE